ncbi:MULTISPECIES: HAMP domain-containing sensor histidine kinase [unclassified Pseudonocardia]|uniref:sensor histidine kinase n=1 Tax=unclassified Pseudonocardia TaxID=2619320 RepID=UPI0009591A46|nr:MULTISPECIES: HAMP domain-containing sensor histidine kinase [unclassified Pseudonocardia]MBN9097175.1 HAMP domain-containing histidine kinase [Pseudonocardia sp.]OJY39481.1 MAG: histidine kinase [Pseudonocardia sp. 73-21]
MRRRILQSTLLVVTITALVLGGPLAITTWQLVKDLTTAELTGRLEVVATRLGSPDASIDVPGVELAVPPGGRLLLLRDGQPTQAVGSTSVGEDPVFAFLPFGPGGVLRLEEPRSIMRTQQLQVTFIVLLLVVLSVSTGAVVATVTARRLAEPLSDVADRAARLGAGDFRSAPGRHGIPELDRVSDVLDTSAAALADLVQRERELVGDVSHQLRSRLTALQLRLDELATHPDPSARREAMAALEQTEKLTAVLDELLDAARAARAAGAEVADLREGLTAVAEEWRPALKAEGRSLKLRVPDGLLARVTPTRIREAVGALVDNAIQHGGGTVTLSARSTETSILVEVADSGAGVPEELVPHVFDRGVSVGSSTGLGLALARALVEADGGRLELSRARPAMFTIFLPAARADDVVSAPRPARTSPR